MLNDVSKNSVDGDDNLPGKSNKLKAAKHPQTGYYQDNQKYGYKNVNYYVFIYAIVIL